MRMKPFSESYPNAPHRNRTPSPHPCVALRAGCDPVADLLWGVRRGLKGRPADHSRGTQSLGGQGDGAGEPRQTGGWRCLTRWFASDAVPSWRGAWALILVVPVV